jgi:murein DD-endopeptidase MepM/ murein hydrolase activator NlpD
MEKNSGKTSFLKKLRYKYRLSIYRDQTYEEVLNMRLTRLNVLTIAGSTLLFFMIIESLIIAFTPVRELIPGYPDENTRHDIIENGRVLDSLDKVIFRLDLAYSNLQKIISGEEPDNYENIEDTTKDYQHISFQRSPEDSLLRNYMEKNDPYSLSVISNKIPQGYISQIHFFPPVKGIVTNAFNALKNHYGTDVVAGQDELVKATLDGTVIMDSWTLETGYVIQIQHENNLISIYKHNAKLLKHMGEFVKVGDPIAIIGNSGELTTGPHLHFELWYKGTPLDPEDYISF